MWNKILFEISKNNWFIYYPYSNRTGWCGYVQNSGLLYFLKSTYCLTIVFSLNEERKYIFETQTARPLLYSLSLSAIALLCGYFFFRKYKYLYFAKKFIDKIINNELFNDYCGKAIIAVSLLYYLSNNSKYLLIMDNLYNYIAKTKFINNNFVHNNKNLSIDRLSEYEISLKFYFSTKNKKLPDIIENFLKTKHG